MKKFSEVFPSLKTEGTLHELFELVDVDKVTAAPDMSWIRIYLVSPRLIEKATIYEMEKLIKDRLFPNKQIEIKIIEKFTLSEQYTPENLYDAYKDSILLELKNYKMLEYRMLRKSDVYFEDHTMFVTLDDNSISMHLSEELINILYKVMNDRCGMNVHIEQKIVPYVAPEIPESFFETTEDEPGTIKPREPEKYLGYDDKDPKTTLPLGLEDSDNVVLEDKSKGHGTPVKQKFDPKKRAVGYVKKAADPDVLYGKSFDDTFTQLSDILGAGGDVIVRGKVLKIESKEVGKNNTTLITVVITDFTDSIVFKVFINDKAEGEALFNALKQNKYLKVWGSPTVDKYDGEIDIQGIKGIKTCDDFHDNSRTDDAPVKRVELHCHTKMSDMDAVNAVGDIVFKASEWGWDAIAVTDHGNVQAFPDALKAVRELKKSQEKDPKVHVPKVIYGVEGYLVDDLKELVEKPGEYTLDDTFVVFDIETTGFDAVKEAIIQIGGYKVKGGEVIDSFEEFIDPKRPIPFRIEELTGINDSMVIGKRTIDQVLPDFIKFSEGCIAVAHNASFDTGFIKKKAADYGLTYDPAIIDTVAMARVLLPQLNRFKLDSVAKALDIKLENHHKATDDAYCTAEIFIKFRQMLMDRGMHKLKDVSAMGETNPELVKKLHPYHIIILAANEVGRVNLYKLISFSHLYYMHKKPLIPKSELVKYREGLILGSACEAGELYQAIERNQSEEEIDKIADFYDYLEIQPIGNNRFLLEKDNSIDSEEELKDINRRIVGLGDKLHKPVVATCDVHFLNPEDEIYRRIIQYGMGYASEADEQPPIYLRTTKEMLKEFEYLGPDKCEEVVITNSGKIADMCECISPVRPDKCPPVIPNSDVDLRKTCYDKAHEQYGEVLPKIVEDRLERELTSIISNGFAVMYIIAKKLVEHSNSEGYLVGSRGSVGSSFAAYTSGITEVNPLPAHYYCPECKYSDFDSDVVKSYAGLAGADLPDKICPICHKPLKKDGFDIPFETFLGFNGDKEPDIDLNFSDKNQASAHKYTEVIFGKGQTFRAGTISTLADKTAYGYVKNYYLEHGEHKRSCEIDRLVNGCVGVRRTTGQHPGGIIVLPHGEEIYSFTPVQHPPKNDEIITTHFDYHAIDHNLLKLDILGHQDPTMIRMLTDLTGIDPVKDIPLDSKETMSLFQNTDALGIKPEDIGGCPLGALGIPEFGTDFAMQIVLDAKPEGITDLVSISGLAHGTDVWLGNTRDLIMNQTATIKTAICCRDDIMVHLIQMGLDPSLAFKIMENVRKGKVATHACDKWPEWKQEMSDHGVPDWYIGSCEKIKYMFPKAHAAAYVMMAWRIAYCKIYYPLAYYASFFTIRATAFSYEKMCGGKDKLEYYIKEYKKNDHSSPKEDDEYRDMRIVQEFYARGFEFVPIDLYKSKATDFQITEDGKIMPPFTSISGLGESVANNLYNAAKDGLFISRDDIRNRAGVNATLCEDMSRLGILGDLPESNQISIFDIMN